MRWIIRVAAGLVALVVLAAGLLALVPQERVAAALSAQFEGLTGRKLDLGGEVRPRLWPRLGVTTGPVSIANADWATVDAPLFRAESLSVEVNLGALMGGEVRITGLTIDRPEIVLERAADGRQNWTLGSAGGSVPAPATGFTLDEGRISGGSVRFVDAGTGRDITLDGLDARLAVPDLAGPFTLALTGLAGGRALDLDLTGGVFSAFAAGRVVPVTLALTAGGSSLGFDGRAGLAPLTAEGALTADLSDLPALGQVLGLALLQPGPGLGQERLALAGQLTLDGTGAASLRGAVIEADGNRVTGDLTLTPGEARPRLTGQLTAGPVVIGAAEPGGAPAAAGWSEAVIDVGALALADAEVAVAAPSVTLGALRLGETRALVTVERARAVTVIRKLAAYGGAVTGEFVVNGRGGLSVGGNLAFTGIDVAAALADLAGSDRLTGRADADLRFLGVGNSIAAILQGLEGEGVLELGQGALSGLDVVAMLQTLDPAYVGAEQSTRFDGLAGTFTIAGGVLSNQDLKLVAPSLTAAGAGEVDLGRRTLDYRLRPTALAAADGTGGVMVPLLVTGPWAEPRFRLDLEGIARERMEAEAREAARLAEDRAKALLEQRLRDGLGNGLGDGLGVEAAPDEPLGDAAIRGIEDALEDEARRALEDILGGN